MRIRRLIAATVAVAVGSMAAATGPERAVVPAGAAPVAAGHAPQEHRGRCLLVRSPGPRPQASRWATGESSGSAPVRRRRPPPGPGDLEVSIPPVVLIHVYRRVLVVTTNTGVPPRPEDGFWVLVRHRAAPADAAVRARVLADCTSWTPR